MSAPAAAGSGQRCPNCPDAPSRLVFEDGGGRVVRCVGCGLQRAERYPDLVSEQGDLYGDAYFRAAIAAQSRRASIYAELLAQIEARRGGRGRLLDVGCGEGGLVLAAIERGWRAEGTEIASAAIRFARERSGLTVHEGEVEHVDLPDAAFDAVVLNHVLEHVRNPATTLARVRRLLKPDGLLRVEVPNIASLSALAKNVQSRLRLKREPWKHYSTGHHFWFFEAETLARTIRSSGLELVAITAPARQWGRLGLWSRALNALYHRARLGGHLVAWARNG